MGVHLSMNYRGRSVNFQKAGFAIVVTFLRIHSTIRKNHKFL